MNKPTNKKKTWIAPKVIDLDVKNTNSGSYPLSSETTYPGDFAYASSS